MDIDKDNDKSNDENKEMDIDKDNDKDNDEDNDNDYENDMKTKRGLCSSEVEVNQSIFRAGGEGSTLVKQEQISFLKDNFASGATSLVYKGMYTDESGTKHPVAVNEFVLAMTRRMQKKVDKEAKLLQTLNHPNVISFYGRIEGTSSLVTEFIERISVNGEDVSINSVRQLLDELEDNLPWDLRLKIALETAMGVSYLHDSGCIHCDLKSSNVSMGEDEKRKWIIKIGDFAEARAEHKDHLMSQLSFQDPTIQYRYYKKLRQTNMFSFHRILIIVNWQMRKKTTTFVKPWENPLRKWMQAARFSSILESDYASTEFDHLGVENVEENNDLCDALEKSLKEIEESTDFDNRELENEEDNNNLCEALERSLEEIDASSTVPIMESVYASKVDVGECNSSEKCTKIPEMIVPEKKEEVLWTGYLARFGHSSLKQFQKDAIHAVRQARDTVIIQPTASGKNICFQIPALLDERFITVVICPTISLINSHVENLKLHGINSSSLEMDWVSTWNRTQSCETGTSCHLTIR
ncbi:putative serine/threonine-protein kinase kinX [Stylophora pistillata]|uniref:Putative serine/threonine-protein kinase kinX n=1 Tax=Stylophora pistillata TaxID=50429 RepID=A0A2B4SA09_STYPI|nr:putative serine/threonine-protein kinase kinX [Stylophora pistillata]